MKNTIIIEKMQDSDRVIILHLTDGAVKGINYFQGIDSADELIPQFLTADAELTNFVKNCWYDTGFENEYEDLKGIFPSPDYEEIIECIDELIWDYVDLHREIEEMKSRLLSLQNDVKMLKSKIYLAEERMSMYKSK